MAFSQSGSNAVQIPRVDSIPVRYIVFCNLTEPVPDAASLREIATSWIAANVDKPLGDLALAMLELPFFEIEVWPAVRFADTLDRLQHRATQPLLRQVVGSSHAISVSTHDLCLRPRAGLWAALGAGIGLAQNFSGVLVDTATCCAVNHERPFGEFQTSGDFHIRYFTSCPFSDQGGTFWLTTEGMETFGCPNLQLKDLPYVDFSRLGWVVLGICQKVADILMEDGASADEKTAFVSLPSEVTISWADFQMARADNVPAAPAGVPGSLTVRLAMQPPFRGDGDDMLTVLPPFNDAREYGAWVHAIVSAFFEPDADDVTMTTDTAMADAHAKAVATLSSFKTRFLEPGRDMAFYGVKKAFDSPAGSEVIWISVTNWSGEVIEGTLANQPNMIPELKVGQRVTLRESEVYDWVIGKPDGTSEGGFTDEILKAQQKAKPVSNAEREARVKELYKEYAVALKKPRVQYHWGWMPWPIVLVGKLFKMQPPFSKLVPVVPNIAHEHLAVHGRLVVAYIVQANRSLFAPGKNDAPCLAVFAFDDEPINNDDMIDIAESLMSFKGSEPTDPADGEAAELVNNEKYVEYRRRRVPDAIAKGRKVWAVDLMIYRRLLDGGKLENPMVACLAWPGDNGPIEMVPYQMFAAAS